MDPDPVLTESDQLAGRVEDKEVGVDPLKDPQPLREPSSTPIQPNKPKSFNTRIHFCHPKEWIVIASLIVGVIALRSFLFWNGSSKPSPSSIEKHDVESKIRHTTSASQVRHLTRIVCQPDLDILCGRYQPIKECALAFGSPLAWLFSSTHSHLNCSHTHDSFVWDMLPVSTETREKLKHASSPDLRIPGNISNDERFHLPTNTSQKQLSNEYQRPVSFVDESLLPLTNDGGRSDESTHWLSYLFLLAHQKMWDRIVPRLEERSDESVNRMITSYTSALTRLFTGIDERSGLAYGLLPHLEEEEGMDGGPTSDGTSSKNRYGISQATISGLAIRAWLPRDLFAVMRWSIQLRSEKRELFEDTDPKFYSNFLPQVLRVISQTQLLVTEWEWSHIKNPTFISLRNRNRNSYYYSQYQLFPTNYESRCMKHHSYGKFITASCKQAVVAARAQLASEEMERGGGFEIIGHAITYMGNLVIFLLLLVLRGRKLQHMKKLERGRRRLQQELDDPFLKQSLEHKAKKMLPESQQEQFISNLTLKARENSIKKPNGFGAGDAKADSGSASWDTEAVASRRLYRDIQRYWVVIIVYLVLVTIAYTVEILVDFLTPSRYLEIVLLALLCFGAPYILDLDQSPKSIKPAQTVVRV